MVSSRPLKLTMVSLKPLNCQWSSQINILLKEWNYPVVTITILSWLFCSKVYCQSSLIFIAAHCSCKPNLPHATNHFACYYTATSSPPESFNFRQQRSIETILNLKTIVDHCPQNF